MSVCANIYCLFRQEPPTSERVASLQATIWNRLGYSDVYDHGGSQYGRLVPEEDADVLYDFHEDGTVERLHRARYSPLLGNATREGRFYTISYLTRWWSEDYPDGPMGEYAITLLTLLAQPDIELVWLGRDEWISMSALSSAEVHQMLDAYIRIGQG